MSKKKKIEHGGLSPFSASRFCEEKAYALRWYSKRISWLPNWKLNTKTSCWTPAGACPWCEQEQTWGIVYDDSLYVLGNTFRASVSCKNPQCGRQIRLTVKGGKQTIEKGD